MASDLAIKPPPAASSPPSTTNPATSLSRQPPLALKPVFSAASPPATSPATPSSLTSREWVVPPRPKPGRKPATDTPPTKRKAQNRAAQRAFRERRAARVGELEEQIKKIEEEDEEEQVALREHIAKLEIELERCHGEINLWSDRYRALESDMATEKAAKQSLIRSLENQSSTEVVPLPRRKTNRKDTSEPAEQQHEEVTHGCGNCSPTTNCQCIDEAFNISHITQSSNDYQSHNNIKPEPPDEMEIDFTSSFNHLSSSTSRNNPNPVSPSSAMADRCGFCQDGTPCICAEMAAADERTATESSTLLPRINHLSQFTPPPSEGDVASSSRVPQIENPCASGPGTCAQCRADPNSTLFCKSLAASRSLNSKSNPSTGGCCGGNANGGGCCQSQTPKSSASGTAPATRSRTSNGTSTPNTSSSTRGPTLPGITLTCADAYQTLSRHPGYERASGEIGTWMPKLHAVSGALPPSSSSSSSSRYHGRPAMEIDAANVMSVLKEFDRRFGENC